ncbi:MAG: sigma-70 family RNA polymerase sigma factor [Actinomycetota bacterium]|nr:sigma-70 family RNA polymerase sigma factor [Actinomycetota bacterium]
MGDNEALGALLGEQYDRCYAVCRRMLGNDDDALDATQEAMLAIVRGIAHFDGRSRFSTWCYRIASNAALDELRRRKRRPHSGTAGVSGRSSQSLVAGGPPAVAEVARASPSRADVVGDAVADRLSLDAALALLPIDQRTAVVLRDVADLDYAEIARLLRAPMGTVRSRIARGRTALAQLLGAPDHHLSVTGSSRNLERLDHVEVEQPPAMPHE